MGNFRIKPASVEELIDRDPYDFFSLEEPHTIARRLRPEIWFGVCVGMLASFSLAALAFWHLVSQRTESDDRMSAYCEIKVIDSDGRPVPGAHVREKDKALGVTDSFGEWRRFVNVKPGMILAFTIMKKTNHGTVLSAVKNLAVPLSVPDCVELELSGSVQLGKLGASMTGNVKPRADGNGMSTQELATPSAQSPALTPASTEFATPSKDATEAVTLSAPTRTEPGVAEEMLPSDALGASASSNSTPVGLKTMPKTAPPSEISFDAVWILAEATSDPRLVNVLTYLKRRAIELGLRIVPDAPWRITLRHLGVAAEMDGQSGLIGVEGSYQTAQRVERLFAYLRNYQEDNLKTARDILWSVTQHVRKAHRVYMDGESWILRPPLSRLWQLTPGRFLEDSAGKLHRVALDPAGSGRFTLVPSVHPPCLSGRECDVMTMGVKRLSPVRGWQRMKLRILGPIESDTDVFVSGYLAQQRPGNVFEYWGSLSGSANVTVVKRRKVLFRERVTTGLRSEATISLPQAPISLR